MSARVESTEWSTVIWCTDCPDYSDGASTTGHGHDVAVLHEQEFHPDVYTAKWNRWNFRRKAGVEQSETG